MFEPCQFALRGSRAGAGIANQLGCIEAPFGLAEEHAEDALLRLGKERIRETLPRRAT
jgi:hypothetical protein